VCIERYYNSEEAVEKRKNEQMTRMGTEHFQSKKKKPKWFGWVVSALLVTAGFVVYLLFIPQSEPAEFLKDLYLTRFMTDVGGENSITAIYLAYRVYDTLFEALILVISVVAVVHLSYFAGGTPDKGRRSEIERSGMTAFTMRLICPVIFIFAVYLIANGHISAGGGFQGGLAVATFFICRYLIHGIYDLPVKVIVRLEEIIFIAIVAVAIFVVVLGISAYIPESMLPVYRIFYLVMMNILIGLKVACGFFVLFYRFITIERR
jgi:multicomponent Na+:H+ antiporter subunit B